MGNFLPGGCADPLNSLMAVEISISSAPTGTDKYTQP